MPQTQWPSLPQQSQWPPLSPNASTLKADPSDGSAISQAYRTSGPFASSEAFAAYDFTGDAMRTHVRKKLAPSVPRRRLRIPLRTFRGFIDARGERSFRLIMLRCDRFTVQRRIRSWICKWFDLLADGRHDEAVALLDEPNCYGVCWSGSQIVGEITEAYRVGTSSGRDSRKPSLQPDCRHRRRSALARLSDRRGFPRRARCAAQRRV